MKYINKLKDIYNDLTTTKYEQSKEKYMIDKKKFNIKSIIIFCCLVISLILMFVSVFIDEMLLFIAGSVLIILITLFGFINNKNPKNSYNFMYKSCQKYYESNMDEKDINEIYRLEHLFPILQEISDLETDKPIKIHANSRGIDILYIDKNKYPKTIEIIPYVDLQIASIDFKDIKNIEITNKDFSIINITLPLKYSDTYKELTY